VVAIERQYLLLIGFDSILLCRGQGSLQQAKGCYSPAVKSYIQKKRLIGVLPTTSVSVPRNLSIRVVIYHSSSQVTKRSGYFLLSSLLCCSSWYLLKISAVFFIVLSFSRTQCSSSFLHDLQRSLSSDVDPLSLHKFLPVGRERSFLGLNLMQGCQPQWYFGLQRPYPHHWCGARDMMRCSPDSGVRWPGNEYWTRRRTVDCSAGRI
jgi:hypothetical protein